MKLICPVNKDTHVLTSTFGNRSFSFNGKQVNDFHNGVDYAPKSGQPTEIYAVCDGVVTMAGLGNPFSYAGQTFRNPEIRIKSPLGVEAGYLHMSAIYVKVGQTVKQGEVIGLTGKEGATTAVHVHFMFRTDGDWIDPLPYISGKEIPEPQVMIDPAKTLPHVDSYAAGLKPWQFQVRQGIWISNVVQEMIDAGLWKDGNDKNAWAKFCECNKDLWHNDKGEYATPQGGFKPGMIVNFRMPD